MPINHRPFSTFFLVVCIVLQNSKNGLTFPQTTCVWNSAIIIQPTHRPANGVAPKESQAAPLSLTHTSASSGSEFGEYLSSESFLH